MIVFVMTLMVVMVLLVDMGVMVVKAMMVRTLESVSQGMAERIMPWPREVIDEKGGLGLSVVGSSGCGWDLGQLESHSLQCCSP